MIKKYLLNCIKTAALVVLGVCLAVVLLEIGVRLVGAKPETYLRKFSRYHPILGWEKTPNIEGTFLKGNKKIYEKINSRGLRDINYDYEKPFDTVRILVLGDSFTEGYDVEFSDLFTEILEKKLNDSLSPLVNKNFDVINAGTGGYSTDQEYLFYKIEGHKYNPDIVLLMVYAPNDIYYNCQSQYGNYFKPLFQIHFDSLQLMNTPLPEPEAQESVKNIFRDMALYPIVTKTILVQFPSIAKKLGQLGFISKSTLTTALPNSDNDSAYSAYPPSFGIFATHETPDIQYAWNITSKIISTLNKDVLEKESSLWLFSIPDRFQIYEESWQQTQNAYLVNDSTWDLTKPNRKLASICSNHSIPFLDFDFYLKNNNLTHIGMYNGVHWNEEGNMHATNYIYTQLKIHFIGKNGHRY